MEISRSEERRSVCIYEEERERDKGFHQTISYINEGPNYI